MNGVAATEKLVALADSFGKEVLSVANAVLDHPKFPLWTGSSKAAKHHYGLGGLAAHTLEVAELCLANNAYFGVATDERHMFLAALFHDAGKMWDYRPTNEEMTEWTCEKHKNYIHHISRSGIVWTQAVERTRLFEDVHEDVLHAILSHHGLREWGSPVPPQSRMAWLLHLCDNMSARMFDCVPK